MSRHLDASRKPAALELGRPPKWIMPKMGFFGMYLVIGSVAGVSAIIGTLVLVFSNKNGDGGDDAVLGLALSVVFWTVFIIATLVMLVVMWRDFGRIRAANRAKKRGGSALNARTNRELLAYRRNLDARNQSEDAAGALHAALRRGDHPLPIAVPVVPLEAGERAYFDGVAIVLREHPRQDAHARQRAQVEVPEPVAAEASTASRIIMTSARVVVFDADGSVETVPFDELVRIEPDLDYSQVTLVLASGRELRVVTTEAPVLTMLLLWARFGVEAATNHVAFARLLLSPGPIPPVAMGMTYFEFAFADYDPRLTRAANLSAGQSARWKRAK